MAYVEQRVGGDGEDEVEQRELAEERGDLQVGHALDEGERQHEDGPEAHHDQLPAQPRRGHPHRVQLEDGLEDVPDGDRVRDERAVLKDDYAELHQVPRARADDARSQVLK